MKALKMLVLAAMTTLLTACVSSPLVKGDYDRQADFARYRTFGYMAPLGTDKAGYGTLLTERLKHATRSQMEQRGYVYSAASPDLLINFNGKLRQKALVTATPMGAYYGYRAGFYGGWPGYGWSDAVYPYTEGVLNIDLVDARRKQMVWEGIAVGEVRYPEMEATARSVDQAVMDIFTQYPFRAGVATPQPPDTRKP